MKFLKTYPKSTGKLNEFAKSLEKVLINPTIILFGSLTKSEAKRDSDIVIFSDKKEIDLKKFENKFKMSIQLFWFKSIKDIKNKKLTNNIINGYTLNGRIRL